MAQNWSLSRSLLFLSQKSSAVTLNSVQSSISLCRVTLYIVTSFFKRVSASLDSPASSVDSNISLGSATGANLLPFQGLTDRDVKPDYNGLDFRLIIDSKSGPPVTITLVASTLHEKAAWCSDISQVGHLVTLHRRDFSHHSKRVNFLVVNYLNSYAVL